MSDGARQSMRRIRETALLLKQKSRQACSLPLPPLQRSSKPTEIKFPPLLDLRDHIVGLSLSTERIEALNAMLNSQEAELRRVLQSTTRSALDKGSPVELQPAFIDSSISWYERTRNEWLSSLLEQLKGAATSPTYSQILLAAIDQIYHSPVASEPGFKSTAELAKLHNSRGIIPYVPGTSFQTQFGHLFGYGATYYSYLFDRAIASKVWRHVFSADPLNRDLGNRFQSEVLQYGGGRDPWQMLSALLGIAELGEGDKVAMEKIGQWRIEEGSTLEGH